MKRIASVALASASAISVAEQLPMEHVLVSVPLHKKQAETALPVTVLTGEELQRQAATTIGETLGSKPGIASASFGPGVGRPVIRGQQGPRAITLQNGTLSADVSGLSPDHGVAVEALLADSRAFCDSRKWDGLSYLPATTSTTNQARHAEHCQCAGGGDRHQDGRCAEKC